MDSGRMAHSFVQVALLTLLGAAMCSDVARTPDKPLVLYVGYWSPQRDDSFDYFVGLIRRTHPELLEFARFEFLATPDNDDRRMADILRKAVTRHPALVIAPNGSSAMAMHQVAPATPVVFATFVDPVRSGLVEGMGTRARPITGISNADWLDGKRLEILHQAYPGVRNVAVLADRSWADNYDGRARLPAEAARLGLHATVLLADDDDQARTVFSDPRSAEFDAWYVPATYLARLAEVRIVAQMRVWHRPCIFALTDQVNAGGLLAYAQDTEFVWPALVDLTQRVLLGGENPGAIPIVRPDRFVLAVRTSADTGVPPPDISIVRRADVVVR